MKDTLITSREPIVLPSLRRRPGLWIAGSAGILIIFLAIAWGVMMMLAMPVPADLNYATTRLTDNGLYRVAYTAPAEVLPINEIHTWKLHVTTPDGRPVENATITVDGDMPQHGHGLPTRPQVTQYLGNGEYLVEGMKFQMGGWWIVEFDITVEGQTDHVTFNLMLQR
jgi:uncharacterized protein (DUF58 family)